MYPESTRSWVQATALQNQTWKHKAQALFSLGLAVLTCNLSKLGRSLEESSFEASLGFIECTAKGV